ncbi:MAG TPA: hypothetical protein VGP72_29880 [Planctomycetota bacterium]|jgi:hypothetical protein
MAEQHGSYPVDLDESAGGAACHIQRLAADEAATHRSELTKLYDQAAAVLGDTRYHLLWRLSELERVCRGLERHAQSSSAGIRCRTEVARLVVQALELRDEARLLLQGYQSNSRKSARRSIAPITGRADSTIPAALRRRLGSSAVQFR